MPDPSATPVALMVGNRSVTSHRTMCYRVLLVCGLAFLFRIAFVWAIYRSWPVWYFWHNGFEANNIAASIVNGNGFASPFGVATGPTAWLPPIYPALNALWFWLFGTFRGPALICILFFNIACGTATVGVLYTVGSRFSRQVAFVSAIVWGASLDAIGMNVRTWESSLSALLVITAVLLHFQLLTGVSKLSLWVFYSIFWAFVGLTNTALLSLMPLSVIAITWRASRTACRNALVGVMLFVVLLMPWTIRNYVALHKIVVFRNNLGPQLWYGNHPGVTDPADKSILISENNLTERAAYISLGDVGYAASRGQMACEFIRTHPKTFARLTWGRFLYFWSSSRIMGRVVPSLISLIAFLGLLLLTYRNGWRISAPFISSIFLYPLPYYVTHTESLFRYPIEPILLLLASYFCLAAFEVAGSAQLRGPRLSYHPDFSA